MFEPEQEIKNILFKLTIIKIRNYLQQQRKIQSVK